MIKEDTRIKYSAMDIWGLEQQCSGKLAAQGIWHEFSLVNIFNYMYPQEPDFKTYIQGSQWSDFALGLLKNVDDWNKIETTPTIYYESFFHQYKEDHYTMVINVPSKILFENSTISLFDPAGWWFSNKDVKAAPKYLCNIYKHLLCQNIPRCIDQLKKHKKPNQKEAEKIDKQITAGCINSEKKYH